MRAGIIIIAGLLLLCPGALAHMPGASEAPEVYLGPIVILEGGETAEISIDDVADYHGLMTNSDPDACICCICMFRAAKAGLAELYGDEIPERSDIGITSYLPSAGSVHTAMLVTGTGPKIDCNDPGQLQVLRFDGTEIEDLSNPSLKSASSERSMDNYHFIITRLSTGEYVEISVSDGMFPEDFFDLRKKVKVEKTSTEDENNLFLSEWGETRDKFLESQDWEIFNEIEEPEEEEPDVTGGAIFLTCLICGLLIFVFFVRK
ncbi:MAG: hypothetical protein JW931_03310 [Methanomicrobiaceae archaeon]|nr:hypothetical protein [Methanomicrobiaceae archaeon]